MRTTCGGLLIVAALLKGQPDSLAAAAGPTLGWWPMMLLVQAELVLGLALVFGLWARVTHPVAAAFFCCGALVSAYKGVVGERSCGCFGALAVHPWATMVVDGVAAAGMCWLIRRRQAGRASMLRLSGFGGLLALLSVPLALHAGDAPLYLEDESSTPAPGQLVVLEPQRWVGRRLPLLRHIEAPGDLARGEWTVILYHDHCPKCRRRIEAEQRAGASSRLAVIEMPPYGAARPTGDLCYGRLSDAIEWFAVPPLVLRLREGVVVSAADGVAE